MATRTVGQNGRCFQVATPAAMSATAPIATTDQKKRLMPATGELEGSADHARQGPWSHNFSRVPRPKQEAPHGPLQRLLDRMT
jgi:hypothetical protein